MPNENEEVVDVDEGDEDESFDDQLESLGVEVEEDDVSGDESDDDEPDEDKPDDKDEEPDVESLQSKISQYEEGFEYLQSELTKRDEHIDNVNAALRESRGQYRNLTTKVDALLKKLNSEDDDLDLDDDAAIPKSDAADLLLEEKEWELAERQLKEKDDEEKEVDAQAESVRDYIIEDAESFRKNHDDFDKAQKVVMSEFAKAIRVSNEGISEKEVRARLIHGIVVPMQRRFHGTKKSLAEYIYNKAVDDYGFEGKAKGNGNKKVASISRKVRASKSIGTGRKTRVEIPKNRKDLLNMEVGDWDKASDEDPDLDAGILEELGQAL